MHWPEAESDLFPSPRRDEPGRLRQDILDELSDHLALAAERERAHCEDEELVWRRVLARFGSPDSLARQLWWDAMKEGIMREWIKTGSIVVAAVAMVVFMGLLFVQVQRTNRDIVTALRDRNAAAAGTTTALNVYLHRNTPDGPPAEGVAVEFSGKLFGAESISVNDVTGADGRLHFGPLQQGEYQLRFTDGKSGLSHERTAVIWAGHGEDDLHIAVPGVGRTDVTLDAGVPVYNDDAYQRLHVELESRWAWEDTVWTETQDLLLGSGGVSVAQRSAAPSPGAGRRPSTRTAMPFGREGHPAGPRTPRWFAGDSVSRTVPIACVPLRLRNAEPVFDCDDVGGFVVPRVVRSFHDYGSEDIVPAEADHAFLPVPGADNTFALPVPNKMRDVMYLEATAWRDGKALNDFETNLPLALARYTDLSLIHI